MTDFFKKFLLEDGRRLSANGRFVGLAAFGKHPGWDDHVEDLGLETESLNLAKTVLYIKGIGGQIDAGAWERLGPTHQLPAFNHLFVWQRSGQVLLGRMWSSSDGKGRTRYPMVVCLHFIGVTLGVALKQGLTALAELAEGCAATSSAGEVRSLLARKRAALRQALPPPGDRREYAPLAPETLHQILHPNGEARPEAFLRVLYQAQSQLGTFAPGAFNDRSTSAIHPQQLRVPAATPDPEAALLFWTRFFSTQVDSAVPLLLTLPLGSDWVDATAGEPTSHEFFCLRASPKAMPLVSEVPYNLDEAFRAKAAAFFDAFQRGEPTGRSLRMPAASPPVKSGWRKWLAIVVLLVLGAAAGAIWFKKNQVAPAPANLPEPGPVTPKPVADVQAVPPTPTEAAAPSTLPPAPPTNLSQTAGSNRTSTPAVSPLTNAPLIQTNPPANGTNPAQKGTKPL